MFKAIFGRPEHAAAFLYVLAHLSSDQRKDWALAAFPKLALWLLCYGRDADTVVANLDESAAVWREALRAPDGMEVVAMLLRYIWCVCEKLFEQGRQEGREEGRQEAAGLLRSSLKKLLSFKFGNIDAPTLARIDAANLEQLDQTIERIMSVHSIDELFAEPSR